MRLALLPGIGHLSNRSFNRWSLTPKISLSLIMSSFWSPNSQVAAFVFKSVTYGLTLLLVSVPELVSLENCVFSRLAIFPELL